MTKNHLHFDHRVSGGLEVPFSLRKERVESEVRRLTGFGATRSDTLEKGGVEHYAVAMADPEGNELDGNRRPMARSAWREPTLYSRLPRQACETYALSRTAR